MLHLPLPLRTNIQQNLYIFIIFYNSERRTLALSKEIVKHWKTKWEFINRGVINMEKGELPPKISFYVTFKLHVDWAKQTLMKAKHFEKLGCVDSRDQSSGVSHIVNHPM